MQAVDAQLRAALLEQLARRRETLAAGAERVGWKLGVGERESIGGSIAVGYLTSATRLEPDGTYRVEGLGVELRADVELAVELRGEVNPEADAKLLREVIAGYAVALEIVDLAPVLAEAEAVVARNVFHRAVAIGPMRSKLPTESLRATARVNGEVRETAQAEIDLAERLLAAARILEAVGERMIGDDVIITGSIVQIPIVAGDQIAADLGSLGSVRLRVLA